ncbi:hypothetical protein L3Q82_012248, partial [Scortum barcoo]
MFSKTHLRDSQLFSFGAFLDFNPLGTGIYLLDIIYIDSAYPASDSIIETEQRTNQMNNLLRVISDLQMSCNYDHLVTLPHVQKYLLSVRYIEELQKFVEDDNFKLSLKIEPGNSSPRIASSKEDLAGTPRRTGTLYCCSARRDAQTTAGDLSPTRRCREATLSFTGVNSSTWRLSWGATISKAHTSLPPLTLGNSRVVEGPAPLKDLGSRAQAVCGGLSEVSASLRYNRRPTCPDASVGVHIPTPPPSHHRKSHSLGNNMMCQYGMSESRSATFPIEKARHLLDDSFLESQSPVRNDPHSTSVSNGLSLGSSESSFGEELSPAMERGRMYATLGPNWRVPLRNSPRSRSYVYSSSASNSCYGCSEAGSVIIEGPLRRKTLLKEGRKPRLSSWTRFWITLSGSTLTFYGAKALRASERKHYKSSPCKKVCVTGWMVVLPDDPARPNIFQLNDPDKGLLQPTNRA